MNAFLSVNFERNGHVNYLPFRRQRPAQNIVQPQIVANVIPP